MKKVICVLLVMLLVNKVQSQSYKAEYTWQIENSFWSEFQKAKSSNGRISNEILKEGDLKKEMLKAIQGGIIGQAICSKDYVVLSGSKVQMLTNEVVGPDVSVKTKANNNGTSYIDLSDYTVVTIKHNLKKKTVDTTYTMLDTAKMQVYRTGEQRHIRGYDTEEYKLVGDDNERVSIWATKELPNYIIPSIMFGLGIEGGIVQIEFKRIDDEHKGAKLTLTSIEKTEELPDRVASKLAEPNRVRNPFDSNNMFW